MRPLDLYVESPLNFILSQTPDTNPLRFLDVGCGPGLLARRLQALGHEVVAIDESQEEVDKARSSGVDARLATFPDFDDAPFDVILFMLSLHHVHHLEAGIEQTWCLLRPGGLVIVDDFVGDSDPVTAGWFHGLMSLVNTGGLLNLSEGSFLQKLIAQDGDLSLWQRDPHLHTLPVMDTALKGRFETLYEGSAPHLYRHLARALPDTDDAGALLAQFMAYEQQMAQFGATRLLGWRYAGQKDVG